MGRIPGIILERDHKGKIRYARIDLKRYGEQLRGFFNSLGVEIEESPYDLRFVKKIRTSEQQSSVKLNLNELWN